MESVTDTPLHLPRAISVRGARVNNLRAVDVDIPLWCIVGVTGVSGSGKSSLAMGVLYAEGSRRLLSSLSAYSRRRIAQEARPDVDQVDHLPATVALRQNPPIPGRRSTVGTMTEVLNIVRLIWSRLATHPCPNGHAVHVTLSRTAGEHTTCPTCGVTFELPSAESFASASLGACPTCGGMGVRDEVDPDALIDPDKTIADGAVLPWSLTGRAYQPTIVAELGVRTDVPFRELTTREQGLILDGPPERRTITVTSKAGRAADLSMVFESARRTVENAAASADSETTRDRLRPFLLTTACPACRGTGLRPEALASTLDDQDIAAVLALDLTALATWAEKLPVRLPSEVEALAGRLGHELGSAIAPLLRLGLGHLGLNRSGHTLSTGERQRIQLATTLQARSTGMLHVLDEPSIGLHPANVTGVAEVIRDLVSQGNSVVIVDHDVLLLRATHHLIEVGPGAGRHGGLIVAQGAPDTLAADPASVTGPYLRGNVERWRRVRQVPDAHPHVRVRIKELYTLRDVTAAFPVGRLTLVTGVSGSGKTALVLESLVPAVTAALTGRPLPRHVTALDAPGIRQLVEVDASTVGKNARSTPATYSGVFDAIRRLYARSDAARERGWTTSHFSYNTGEGRCSACEGLGELALDLQFMPDLKVPCPACHGQRYNDATLAVTVDGRSIADALALTVDDALEHFGRYPTIAGRLRSLRAVGLGYLSLGEPTPALSGGEAQRLRLAERLRLENEGVLYIFDEPSIGLHPRDVGVLVGVFDQLLEAGATVVAIDHDLDLIAQADHVIDLGPGGGPGGGRIVSSGTPDQVALDPASITGQWLRQEWGSTGETSPSPR